MQHPIFEDAVSGKYTLYPDNTWSERSALLMVINNTEPLVAIPIQFRTRTVCLIAVYYRASNIGQNRVISYQGYKFGPYQHWDS